MRIKNIVRNEKLICLSIILIIIILYAPLSLAQNDPGHDTLYIEQTGDSQLTGKLNITDNAWLKGKSIVQNYLDIYANGSYPTPGSSQIAAILDAMYIDSPGNIYINNLNGGSGTVFFGDSGDTVNVNISGALFFKGNNFNRLGTGTGSGAATSDLYWGDKLVCDASVANCGWGTSTPSSGIGNVSANNPSANYIPLWYNATALNNSAIYQQGGNIGIGTTSPSTAFQVVGTYNLSSSTQKVYQNTTCVIIEGATSQFAVC